MAQQMRRSRLGYLLALGYLGVFVAAECLMLFTLLFHTAHSEFSGLGIILVALPWSLLLTPVGNAVGYIDWYNRFAGMPLVYGLLATVTVLPGVLLNTAIAYWIGRSIGRATERVQQ